MNSLSTRNDTISIRELMCNVFGVWESLQADHLELYFRKGPHDKYFHYYSPTHQTWQEYREVVQKFMDDHLTLKLEVEDIRVFETSDVVYVAITHAVNEKLKNGKEASREARYTGVLLPLQDSWRIVHEHWSLPKRAAGWENY